jgi:hypothetical protein
MVNGWKKEIRGNQINYIKKNRAVGDSGIGIIVIQKIPDVNLKTLKIKGYTYSVRTNRTYWKRFKTKSAALKQARIYMRKN